MPLSFETSCAPSTDGTRTTGSMNKASVSIVNCSSRCRGRRLRRRAVGCGLLQTIRSGIIAGLTKWKNRKNSGIVQRGGSSPRPTRRSWTQIGAVDKAIALAMKNDSDLSIETRSSTLVTRGVGEIFGWRHPHQSPESDCCARETVVAYAGLNPRQHGCGNVSRNQATRCPRLATPFFAPHTVHCRPYLPCGTIPQLWR